MEKNNRMKESAGLKMNSTEIVYLIASGFPFDCGSPAKALTDSREGTVTLEPQGSLNAAI